jgi:hypothetical protein
MVVWMRQALSPRAPFQWLQALQVLALLPVLKHQGLLLRERMLLLQWVLRMRGKLPIPRRLHRQPNPVQTPILSRLNCLKTRQARLLILPRPQHRMPTRLLQPRLLPLPVPWWCRLMPCSPARWIS